MRIAIYLDRDRNRVYVKLDWTSIESERHTLTYGLYPHRFYLTKKLIDTFEVSATPLDQQSETCLWDFNLCSAGKIKISQNIALFFFSRMDNQFNIVDSAIQSFNNFVYSIVEIIGCTSSQLRSCK